MIDFWRDNQEKGKDDKNTKEKNTICRNSNKTVHCDYYMPEF